VRANATTLAGSDGVLMDVVPPAGVELTGAMASAQRALAHARRATNRLAAEDTAGALDAWDDALVEYGTALTLDEHLTAARCNRAVAFLEKAGLLQAGILPVDNPCSVDRHDVL